MLNTLRDITQAVAAANSLDVALDLLVVQTKQAMATECCSIYLLEQQQLVLSATEGLQRSAIGNVKMPLSQGLVGLAAEREEAVNLADARVHPRFKLFPEVAEEEYRAFLAVPIIYQKMVVGVIVVQQPDARQFSEGEEAFLMTLAAQLAVVIRSLKNRAAITNVQDKVVFSGTTASSGIAIAKGFVLGGAISLEQVDLACDDIEHEIHRTKLAINRSRDKLNAISQRFEHDQAEDVASIFSAFKLLLDDNSLGGEYIREVAGGWRAESAVSRVSIRYIEQFLAMDDPYLKERASDIRELGQKVLRQLIEPDRLELEPDTPVILVAKEVDATMLAEFPRHKLAGIVTKLGGVNAHAAILARALGVPALIGVEQALETNLDNKLLVLNATRGQLLVSPSPTVVDEYRVLINADVEKQKRFSAELTLPAETLDGIRIHLYLNAGLLSGMESNIADGADGIGLYRTEIPFMLHQRFPSEAEQIKVYQQVLSAAGTRPVVMRTLDVGGDKPLPYFPIKEDNPFLGWRGIRLSLDHPELFLVQLRAMLQAGGSSQQLQILLPMVSNLDEIDQTLEYLDQAYEELNVDINHVLTRPKIGVMLEVPALLYQLADVAKRVDFVSVGSNDLTQYLLAVDRNNPSVSTLFDSYHPGILRALKRALDECQQYKLDVSVCGELAGEPYGALLLVAMGYTKLSMNQASLARINYLLRRVSCKQLNVLLESCLSVSNATQVKQLLQTFTAQHQLEDILH
ncbi:MULTISPECIES: phosphoenolpyruvate--protein phosphotransferase [Pseudomonadati]|uniref:phosphoenolpyruvate--protein phosphotransferase n=1 Tax=Shewanella aestuarii TaxID=1028752 RepID=A0ABT0L187_9GAMM|nr:phosphoenolpyruvate--protein phosphotransferase [Shewanella aestuarii]MCL1117001.1 phosphoenolpyruvate--protein phosphotransferase [Shewanella aestuarii]GGN78018.1 phosphoenolpyruvate--protein phosphotransferase [Shewanella aestuarii]